MTLLRIVAYLLLTRLMLADLHWARDWWEWVNVGAEAVVFGCLVLDHVLEWRDQRDDAQ